MSDGKTEEGSNACPWVGPGRGQSQGRPPRLTKGPPVVSEDAEPEPAGGEGPRRKGGPRLTIDVGRASNLASSGVILSVEDIKSTSPGVTFSDRAPHVLSATSDSCE